MRIKYYECKFLSKKDLFNKVFSHPIVQHSQGND